MKLIFSTPLIGFQHHKIIETICSEAVTFHENLILLIYIYTFAH